MLDVVDRQPVRRLHRERVAWAIFCGVDAAWIVASQASSVLDGGALSWLALLWLFEGVFGVTVTLMWSWCYEDDFAPQDPQLSSHAFEQFWADDLRPDRRFRGEQKPT